MSLDSWRVTSPGFWSHTSGEVAISMNRSPYSWRRHSLQESGTRIQEREPDLGEDDDGARIMEWGCSLQESCARIPEMGASPRFGRYILVEATPSRTFAFDSCMEMESSRQGYDGARFLEKMISPGSSWVASDTPSRNRAAGSRRSHTPGISRYDCYGAKSWRAPGSPGIRRHNS